MTTTEVKNWMKKKRGTKNCIEGKKKIRKIKITKNLTLH